MLAGLVQGATLVLFTTPDIDQILSAMERYQASGFYGVPTLFDLDPRQGLAVWGHVGDSRIYLFRRGHLAYQTRDHSLVQNMIDAGFGSVAMIRVRVSPSPKIWLQAAMSASSPWRGG